MNGPLLEVPDRPARLLTLRPTLAARVGAYYDDLLRARNPQMPGRHFALRDVHVQTRVRKVITRDPNPKKPEEEEELDWAAEWVHLPNRAASDSSAKVVWNLVLGEPGSGKSTLTNHTVLELADQGTAQLNEGRTLLEELPAPVWLDLARLIQNTASKDGVIERILATLARELTSVVEGTELWRWLGRSLRSGRAWLFLDGLDRVRHKDYGDWLRAIARLGCPTVITCRVRDYQPDRLPATVEVREYRLAKFGRTQQERFVEKWFKGGLLGRDLKRELDQSPGLRATCETPLVLAFACLVKSQAQHDGISPAQSRIYERALRYLLTPQPDSRVAQDVPEPARAHRADELFELLVRVAPQLFEQANGTNLFASGKAKDFISGDQGRPSSTGGNDRQQAQALIDEMIEAGVLLPIDSPDGKPSLSFLHGTLLEFLVARSLWDDCRKPWSPTLRAELEALAKPDRREIMRMFVDLRNAERPTPAESLNAAEVLRLTLAFAGGLRSAAEQGQLKGEKAAAEVAALQSALVEAAVRDWSTHEGIELAGTAVSELPVAAVSEPPAAIAARRSRSPWWITAAALAFAFAAVGLDRWLAPRGLLPTAPEVLEPPSRSGTEPATPTVTPPVAQSVPPGPVTTTAKLAVSAEHGQGLGQLRKSPSSGPKPPPVVSAAASAEPLRSAAPVPAPPRASSAGPLLGGFAGRLRPDAGHARNPQPDTQAQDAGQHP